MIECGYSSLTGTGRACGLEGIDTGGVVCMQLLRYPQSVCLIPKTANSFRRRAVVFVGTSTGGMGAELFLSTGGRGEGDSNGFGGRVRIIVNWLQVIILLVMAMLPRMVKGRGGGGSKQRGWKGASRGCFWC